MKQLAFAFAPFVVSLVLGMVGILNNSLLFGAPAILCATPISLFWAGYYVGRAGAVLQAPISFSTQRLVSPINDLTAEEMNVLTKLRSHRSERLDRIKAQRNDQVSQQTAKEFN